MIPQEYNWNATQAFQTLLIYVRNVVNNPDEGKFRLIRITNPTFPGQQLSQCNTQIREWTTYIMLIIYLLYRIRRIAARNRLPCNFCNSFVSYRKELVNLRKVLSFWNFAVSRKSGKVGSCSFQERKQFLVPSSIPSILLASCL